MNARRNLIGTLAVILLALLVSLAHANRSSWENLLNCVSPQAGRLHSVTFAVNAISDDLALLGVDEFDFAPEFGKDPYLTERVTELNYPVRYRPGANLVIAPASEPYTSEPGLVLRTSLFAFYERNSRVK
jgi:hypothetical protein